MFAAYLNEGFCKKHQPTYTYDDKWDKEYLYVELMKDVTDCVAPTIEPSALAYRGYKQLGVLQ